MYKKRKNNYRKKFFLLIILFVLTTLPLLAQTTDEAPFHFENGELHGFTAGTEAPIIENDPAFAYAGSGSMKVTMETAGTYEVILNSPGEMAAGTPIDIHIYFPAGMVASIQPFILDANWGWNSYWVDKSSITPDTWIEASVLIPQTAAVPINRLGIQIFADTPGTIWIDSINFITEVEIDKSGLEALLVVAEGLLATAVEGEGIDEYAPGSITVFEADVNAARTIYDNAEALQREVDDAVQLLESAIADFLAAKNEIIPPSGRLETLDNGFRISWDSLYADGLFTVRRSLSMAGPYTAIAENMAGTTCTDNDILEGKTYFYTITVSSHGYASEPSTPVYGKILRFAQLQDLPLFKET
ncbi:MAG: hypothetical protein JXJ04_19920, partial [Spirochaetales bacterium]|nr:hypothetical protein [Spirochaetales bacterium]